MADPSLPHPTPSPAARRLDDRADDVRPQPVRLERPWRDGTAIALAILGALVLVQGLGVLFQPLLLFLAATVIATAVSPIAGWLARWMPRTAAVLLIFLAVGVVFALFVWVIVPPLVQQVQGLVDEAPSLIDQAEAWLEERDFPDIGALEDRARSAAESGARVALFAVPTVFGTFIDLLLILAMSVYLSISAPALVQFMLSLVPAQQREYARSVLSETGRTMGGYVRGSVIDGAVLAVLTYVGLTVIGVDFALVLALLAFIGALIPVLGPMLAGAPAVALGLAESPTTAVMVFALYFGLQQVETYLLLPYIMRSQAAIPPLLTLFALVAGAAFAGFMGALLAIPLLGGFHVIVLRVIAPAIRAWTGAAPAPWQASPWRDGGSGGGPPLESQPPA